ncbi:MAG: rod shape-determining protein MreC [Christensenellaceae bacterium]|nr:rod shape-determining protein MreC [Christensenellaceae bacterium]
MKKLNFFKKKKENTEGGTKQRKKLSGNWLRFTVIFLVYVVLTGVFGIMLFSRIMNNSNLRFAENAVATVVSPVQNAFNEVVVTISSYLQKLKIRGNLEAEYNKLLAENEQLVYDAMLAKELQIKLSQYENAFEEISLNESMNPILCSVIGRTSGNYFTVFTINKGSMHGIEDFMAVTMDGALVGYTYNVTLNKSDVRAIIDSEASIAGLIQTSRDQGTIRGTMGIDGKPMCRMYYLPADHLPRPGDEVVTSGVGMGFPKGIPIGTVRESTRGMEENKQYIVIEPKANFKHVENVIVLRYKPEPIAITPIEVDGETIYAPIPSIVPIPTIVIGVDEFILEATYTPIPEGYETPVPTETPENIIVTTTPPPVETDVIEYQPPNATEDNYNVTLEPTATPSPTPPPLNITVEDD